MKRKNNRFALIIATGVIVAVVGGLAFFGFQIVRDMMTLNDLKAQQTELSDQLKTVQGKNADLQKDIDSSDSPSFIERLARELLGWVKPGEIKIVEKDQ